MVCLRVSHGRPGLRHRRKYSARAPRFVALWAALFSIITWWATDFRTFYSIGMVAFATASFLALPYAAFRCAISPTIKAVGSRSLALAVAAALGIFYHKDFPYPRHFSSLPLALALAFWREPGSLSPTALLFNNSPN